MRKGEAVATMRELSASRGSSLSGGHDCDFTSSRADLTLSSPCVKGGDQRAHSIPYDLNAYTNQQKRGKPYDHDHSSLSDRPCELVRQAVTEQNANRNCGHSGE